MLGAEQMWSVTGLISEHLDQLSQGHSRFAFKVISAKSPTVLQALRGWASPYAQPCLPADMLKNHTTACKALDPEADSDTVWSRIREMQMLI